MRALVIGRPKFQIPPEQMQDVVQGAIDWYGRYEDRFTAFGTFPAGGGFGVVEVADEEELNRMILEMPFAMFSDITVEPFVEGDKGFRMFQEAMATMMGAPS
jgi:hypothetical protein